MKHSLVRVDDLLYKGCEPYWKCIHCGTRIPFHYCLSKEQLEQQECRGKRYSGYATITLKFIGDDIIAESSEDAEKILYDRVRGAINDFTRRYPEFTIKSFDINYPHEIRDIAINE